MRKFKHCLAFLAVFSLLVTSCSKDEDSGMRDPGSKMATLSFGAVLNNLMGERAANSKNHLAGFPVCSDAAPAYAEVVLTGTENVGTMADPLVVDISANAADYDNDGTDEYFTLESPDLELTPGSYTLTYFAVYDADGNRLWIAPTSGDGSLALYVDNPLPLTFNLGAGAKKYVDVDVLCYEDRMVNLYGYLFFEIEENRALEFCFFANYCDVNQAHYPAQYSVSFYLGTDNTGSPLYTNVMNTVSTSGADPSAQPLCFALPNLDEYDDDEDYIYYEVSLLDWDAVYGTAPDSVITGTLSRDDITANFDGDDNVNYEHLRFGCDQTPNGGDCQLDSDNDGVANCNDDCPNDAGSAYNRGCPVNGDCEGDADGDGVKDCNDTCPDDAGPADNGGCPVNGDFTTDTDSDGVLDCNDDCINVAGPSSNHGCPEEQGGGDNCGTAWMYGDHTWTKKDNDGLSVTAKWGWAEYFEVGQADFTYNIYQGAGNNKIDDSKIVGTATISSSGTGITLTVNASAGVDINTLHIYTSDLKPTTAAPGQFNKLDNVDGKIVDNPAANSTYIFTYSSDGNFWIAVHADVCR